MCESTGFCSFEDASCGASVRRYGALASPALAGTCVPCVAELIAGARHTCARTQSGELFCWGDNREGQIGDGTQTPALSPATLATTASGAALGPSISLAAGSGHGCAALGDGGLYCWGDNGDGELGNPDLASAQWSPAPVLDADRLPVRGVAVAAGLTHSCAVDAAGAMSCWGANNANQLGTSHLTLASSPWPRAALDRVVRPVLGHGGYHSCALRDDASLWCWGGNPQGQIGNGSFDNALPQAVLPAGTVASAAIGQATTCAVTIDGDVRCWGNNTDGQVGDGTTTDRPLPTQIVELSDVGAISVGAAHACAIRRDLGLWCWGRGADGQLGPAATASALPLEVRATGVLAVAAGAGHTCVLEDDGAVRCFGANTWGQLGNGTATGSAEPVVVNLSCR